MKKSLLFALGAALLFATALQAQGQRTPEDIAKARTDQMKVLLQLKDDQAKKLYDINLRYAQLAKDAHDQSVKQREAAKTQMDGKKGEIEAVLNPSQKAALDAFFAPAQGQKRDGGAAPQTKGYGRPEGRPGAGHGQPGMAPQCPPRGHEGFGMSREGSHFLSGEMAAKMRSEQMKGMLQLSDDQAKKIYDIELKYFNIEKANREAAVNQIKENALKFMNKKGDVEAILTPAQQVAFSQLSKIEKERFGKMKMMRSHSHGAPQRPAGPQPK